MMVKLFSRASALADARLMNIELQVAGIAPSDIPRAHCAIARRALGLTDARFAHETCA
jgi:hypothetical protein